MSALTAAEKGVSLVELLVAMALSALLVVGVSDTVVRLLYQSALSNDRSELNERAAFLLAFFEALVADVRLGTASATVAMPTLEDSICNVPHAPSYGAMRIVPVSEIGCVSLVSVIEGTPALLIETAREDWQRRLFYLRQYAWAPGDGLGALMAKPFKSPAEGFGRAEMVLPGVVAWWLEQPDPSALRIRLVLRGWRRDGGLTNANRAPLVRDWLSDQPEDSPLREVPLQALAVTLVAPS